MAAKEEKQEEKELYVFSNIGFQLLNQLIGCEIKWVPLLEYFALFFDSDSISWMYT